MYREKDAQYIIKAYKKVFDIDISEDKAISMWSQASDLYACGWCDGLEKMSEEDIISETKRYINLSQIFLKSAYSALIDRYISKINSFNGNFLEIPKANKEHILSMLKKLKNEDFNLDKMARWIGYIQGVLAVNQVISVEEEMEFSRTLFQKAYNK